jgi:predicted flavoprotein YhiN
MPSLPHPVEKATMNPLRVVVVGAGPAGLMAAGQAALQGSEVTLLERMPRPARKLLITGKGRCNLTNTCPTTDFLAHFHEAGGRFLKPALLAFPPQSLMDFFTREGVALVEERGGRVFPESGLASSVVDRLVAWFMRTGARLVTGQRVTALIRRPEGGFLVETAPAPLPRSSRAAMAQVSGRLVPLRVVPPGDHRSPGHSSHGSIPGFTGSGKGERTTLAKGPELLSYAAEALVLATGGLSYPATGSSGDGFSLATGLGHTVTPLRPSLVALEDAAGVAVSLAGLTLRNVRATIESHGRKMAEAFGEAEFTDRGLGGPIILGLSRQVVDLLRETREVAVVFDLKPALDEPTLDARLRRECEAGTRPLGKILATLLPQRLVPVCLKETGLEPELLGPYCPAAARRRILHWLRAWRLPIARHGPWEEAIVTAGGITRTEIHSRTLESRLCAGLFFAGEMLDLDADTGGFNLQAAFSTGWLAGRSAATRGTGTSSP